MTPFIVAALRQRLPLDAATAEADVIAVVEPLVRALPAPAGRPVAEAAGRAYDPNVADTASPESVEAEAFARLDHPPHQARAVFRTVLALVAERLDEGPRQLAAKHLPPALADLMCDPNLVEGEPPAREGEGEAGPEPTSVDERRAHDNSVVNASNPHADRKLSSARDAPKVRGEILSEGRAQGEGAASEFAPDHVEDDDARSS